MGGNVIVDAERLWKQFGDVVAVRDLTLNLHAGQIVGFLGPNGAGKSSTVRMFAGVSRRTGGALRVLGADPDVAGPVVRAGIGYLSQRSTLDAELDVRDNIEIHAGYFGLRRAAARRRTDELLAFAGLADRARSRIGELSGGAARRLAISRTLVNDPRLLLLDEPTSGLDPQARQAVWAQLAALRERGVTTLVTTHHMDEAQTLCNRVVVIVGGQVLDEGTPAELIARHGGDHVVDLRFRAGRAEWAAGLLDRCADRVQVVGDRVLLYTGDGEATLGAVRRHRLAPETAALRRACLEDAYLALTGPATDRELQALS